MKANEAARARALMDAEVLYENSAYERAALTARALMMEIYWYWCRYW
jgi:hypothetical protein